MRALGNAIYRAVGVSRGHCSKLEPLLQIGQGAHSVTVIRPAISLLDFRLLHQGSSLPSESTQALCFPPGQKRTFFSGVGDVSDSTSKKYTERRLLGYSQAQLFAVVSEVEHYSEFVPWCQRSTIEYRKPNFLSAELEVGFKLFSERYTSNVTLEEPARIVCTVSDSSLFEHMLTTWDFKPGPTPGSCWLSFSIDFSFKSALYRSVADYFFSEVVQRMMGAFESRCKHQYGASAFAKKPRAGQSAAMAYCKRP